jgi:hypothetical protein
MTKLAKLLGFFDKCDKFAREPQHWDGYDKYYDPNDCSLELSIYYGAFQNCFNEEMASRFKFDGY